MLHYLILRHPIAERSILHYLKCSAACGKALQQRCWRVRGLQGGPNGGSMGPKETPNGAKMAPRWFDVKLTRAKMGIRGLRMSKRSYKVRRDTAEMRKMRIAP